MSLPSLFTRYLLPSPLSPLIKFINPLVSLRPASLNSSSISFLSFAKTDPPLDLSIIFFTAKIVAIPAAIPKAINPAGLAKNPRIAVITGIIAPATVEIIPGSANNPPFSARNIPPAIASEPII